MKLASVLLQLVEAAQEHEYFCKSFSVLKDSVGKENICSLAIVGSVVREFPPESVGVPRRATHEADRAGAAVYAIVGGKAAAVCSTYRAVTRRLQGLRS